MDQNLFRGRPTRRAVIRDRRTDAVLLQLQAAGDSLRGAYLGHRLPKDIKSADLRAKDLSEADLTGRDLSDADLTGAVFTDARYDALTRWPDGFDPERHGAVRVPVDLKGAKLEEGTSLLAGVDLTDADLRGASLKGANLRDVNLTRAKLLGADLSGADMTGATLTGADLRHIRQDAATVWPEGFDLARRLSGTDAVGSVPGLEQTVALLKGLADISRLRMLGLLSQEEHTVEELAAALTLTEPTVSHHLSRLKTLGLVTMREEGTRHRYRADGDALRAALASLPETLIDCLILRHSGHFYAEIAATLGIAIGSVGVLLARGERAFRTAYQTEHQIEISEASVEAERGTPR